MDWPEGVSLITGASGCSKGHKKTEYTNRIRLGTKGPWCLYPVAVSNKWLRENYEKNGADCVPDCGGTIQLHLIDIPKPETYTGLIYR